MSQLFRSLRMMTDSPKPSATHESHPCKNPGMADRRPVISLFSGAGGLDIAVERCAEPPLVQDGTPGPLHVALATDMDGAALDTLAVNLGTVTVPGDIMRLGTKELLRAGGLAPGDACLVIGGPLHAFLEVGLLAGL